MNALRILLCFIACYLCAASARADPLDDLIAEMRRGEATLDPASNATIQARLAATSAAYQAALVSSYLCQVKASIVDAVNHGGWPVRSALIYQPTTRRTLTLGLKARFDRKPDSILAYAIICPAIYARDDGLMNRALAYLKTNDPFLHACAQTNMDVHWRPFIRSVLQRQTPVARETKVDKDDPFSVLPR